MKISHKKVVNSWTLNTLKKDKINTGQENITSDELVSKSDHTILQIYILGIIE